MKYSLRSLMTFSIRDLFWFTIVVALAVGWWVERRETNLLRREFQIVVDFLKTQDIRVGRRENGQLMFTGKGINFGTPTDDSDLSSP
jgi:hypothetical protein